MGRGKMVLIVLSLILLIVGAAIAFVPVAKPSQTVGGNGGKEVLEVPGSAILVSQYFTGTWSSSSGSNVHFCAQDCGTTQPDLNNLNAPCPSPSYLTPGGTSFVNASSGSLSFSVPGGHWLLFSSRAPTSVTLKSSFGTLGPILLIVRIPLLIVGVVLRGSRKAAPAPPT